MSVVQRKRLSAEARAKLAQPQPKRKRPGDIQERLHYEMIERERIAEQKAKAKSSGKPYYPPIEIRISGRQRLCLQVRNGRDQKWGSVKGFDVNPGIDQRTREGYINDLNYWRERWQTSGYFGGDAMFKIATVPVPSMHKVYA